MKKLLFIFALALAGYHLSYGQTPADIYNTFASEAKVQTVSIGDFAIKLAGEYNELAKGIKSINVLTLSECSQLVKDRFAKEVGLLNTDGYEPIVRVNKDNEMVKLFVKVDGDTINELLVIVTGKDPVLVTLKGSFSKSELLAKMDKIKVSKSGSVSVL